MHTTIQNFYWNCWWGYSISIYSLSYHMINRKEQLLIL